jgi:hypothetical protein
MHIQAKSKTALSPADLARFLGNLVEETEGEPPINIEGVTGSAVEEDGFFVFAVEHGREREADRRVRKYGCQWTKDVYAEEIPSSPDPNVPGVLLEIIQNATTSPEAAGRPIDHVLVGMKTGAPGVLYVQVSFIGSVWENHPPHEDD